MLTSAGRVFTSAANSTFGDQAITEIKKLDVHAALEKAAALGWAANSVKHFRVDLSTIFQELVLDDLLATNPAQGVPIPPAAKREKRERVRLTDDEFASNGSASTGALARSR